MYLKLFPSYDSHLYMFNESEVYRIKTKFTSWGFLPNHFFGPYELLNFTLVGPYVTSEFPNPSILLLYVICVANLCVDYTIIIATHQICLFYTFL